MTQILEITEVDSVSQFEDLRHLWNATLNKARDKDVFSTWEWLSCWWKHFGKGKQLRILIVKDKGEIIGIAPLMCSTYSFFEFGRLRKVEFIGSYQSDYNNFILVEREAECLRQFLNYLMACSDWDYLELRDMREDATSAILFYEKPGDESPKLEHRTITSCPYITLPSSTKVFTKRLSANMRRNIRKRMRKLRERYRVEFKTQRDFGSIRKAMNAFFLLHQKRWVSKGKQGIFALRTLRNFHVDIASQFFKKGWLSLYFLTVDDQPISCIYSFDYNRKKYGYLSGFDPEYEKYGVGHILKMYVAEECIKMGFNEYDLARGYEPYKSSWATGVRKNLEFRLLPARACWLAKIYGWGRQYNVSRHFMEVLHKCLD